MRALRTRSAEHAAVERRSADVVPASYDPAANTIDVVWTTGAQVQRFSPFGGPYIESLEVSPRAIRLERLNAGASVLDSHDMYELAAAIGSVEPGSVRIANGQGTATIRLADTPDVADTIAKVRAGHIRSVSVGYLVHAYERLAGDDGELDELRAIDWEPIEISLVTVPADPGATIRLSEREMTRIVDNGRSRSAARSTAPWFQNRARLDREEGARIEDHRGQARGHEHHDDGAARGDRRGQPDRGGRLGRADMVTEDRIRSMCERGELSRAFERELLDQHADDPMTGAQLIRAVNDELMARQGERTINTGAGDAAPGESRSGRNGREEPSAMATRMEDAMFARLSGRAPSDGAREFMGVRMIDMARGLLEQRGVARTRWMSAPRVMDTMARYGAHTTSDFPNILANATRRYLLTILQEYPAPLRPIVHPRTAIDFRAISLAKIGLNPSLLLVPENGEITRGTVVEAAEGYSLKTYARIFAITRQAIINDDLGAFAAIFQGWGRAAAELEATLIAGLITANPTMSDGQALYSAAHGNLAAGGGAINVANLSAARQAMRMQKDLDGATLVGAAPKFLVVGASKETEAESVLTALAATAVGDVNPFPGRLTLLVDPRLPGNSWRLFADPSAWPVIEIAKLEGQEDVFVDSRVGFDVDGVETKARLDIGGAAVDYRGTYLNPGN